LKAGVRYTDGEVEVASLPSLGNGGYSRIGGFVSYRLDTLDNFSLPTEGYFVDLEYLVSHDDFENDSSLGDSDLTSESDTVYEISANFMAAQSIEKHT
ncbi:serine protease, partial [Vibrio sp. 10N.222.55.F8]